MKRTRRVLEGPNVRSVRDLSAGLPPAEASEPGQEVEGSFLISGLGASQDHFEGLELRMAQQDASG